MEDFPSFCSNNTQYFFGRSRGRFVLLWSILPGYVCLLSLSLDVLLGWVCSVIWPSNAFSEFLLDISTVCAESCLCWLEQKSSSMCRKLCVLISTEEQHSGEDSRELRIQVSKKASPSVWRMLPSTICLALFCLYFYSFSLSPKIDDPFMCHSSCLFSVF